MVAIAWRGRGGVSRVGETREKCFGLVGAGTTLHVNRIAHIRGRLWFWSFSPSSPTKVTWVPSWLTNWKRMYWKLHMLFNLDKCFRWELSFLTVNFVSCTRLCSEWRRRPSSPRKCRSEYSHMLLDFCWDIYNLLFICTGGGPSCPIGCLLRWHIW